METIELVILLNDLWVFNNEETFDLIFNNILWNILMP
jgi:hypothetical protein